MMIRESERIVVSHNILQRKLNYRITPRECPFPHFQVSLNITPSSSKASDRGRGLQH